MHRLKTPFLVLLFSSLLLPHLLFSQSSSLHGIDLTDLDRKADPCNDFYEFANGTWRASHPIPASMTRWSKRWAAGESSKDKLKEILDTAAADKASAGPQVSPPRTSSRKSSTRRPPTRARPKAAPSRSSATTTVPAWMSRG
ncbi:MAG: hypothetical protein ABSF72_10555 [Candidatus Sulfotelmatobacter sp.]